MAKVYVHVKLTPLQAKFLRSVLYTHSLVCVPATAARCKVILDKLRAPASTRSHDGDKHEQG
jgi:hypothetical protein